MGGGRGGEEREEIGRERTRGAREVEKKRGDMALL